MKKRFNKVNVDAGSVVAVLTNEKPSENFIPLKKGKYKIKVSVKNCWAGPNENYDFLDVKKDCYLRVCDVAHLDEMEIEDEDLHPNGCILTTGGDGTFSITVELSSISNIPYNPYKKKIAEGKEFWKNNKYSDSAADEFVQKFCKGCYYEELNLMIMDARIGSLQKFLDDTKKFL